MTIRELLVKVSAAVNQETFAKAQQAAERVKDALQKVSEQGQPVQQSFNTVRLAVTNLQRDFSGLTAAIEKHKFVFAGIAAGATALAKSSLDTYRNFQELEHQLRRIAETDENFQRLREVIAQVRKEAGKFTTLEIMQQVREAADESGLAIKEIIELLPAIGKIAAAQGERISDLLVQLRALASGGEIRPKLAGIIGAEKVVQLRQEIERLEKEAKDLGLSLEEIAQLKFELVLKEIVRVGEALGRQGTELDHSLRDLRESFQNFSRAVGEKIAPVFTTVTKLVSGLLQTLQKIPLAVEAISVALMGITGFTALAGLWRILRAVRDVSLGAASAIHNLGVRLAFVLHQAGFQGAAQRLAQMFGLAAREGGVLASVANSLRSVLARVQAGIASLRAAWASSGAAGVASLAATRTAALATSASIRGLAGVVNLVKAALTGLALAGRSLLRLLGPIAAVMAAFEGLMWVIEKVWKKLSGAEAIERAQKALISQAVDTLEKSRSVLAEKMRALGEAQREALEEEFAKIPPQLMAAAQELGAEDFLKLNINTEPIRKLVVEARKAGDDVQALKAKLSELVVGKEAFEGITAEARKAAINIEAVRQKLEQAFAHRFLPGGLPLSETMRLTPIWKQIDEATKGVNTLKTAINELRALPAIELKVEKEGVGWLKELAEKIKREKPTLEEAIRELAQAIADYIPQSPAKRGPLARLHEVGPAFTKTVATSLRGVQGRVAAAMQEVLRAPAVPELLAKVRFVAERVPAALPPAVQRVRRVFEGEGKLPELTQTVRRIFTGEGALPELTQRVRQVPEILADALTPMPITPAPALAFSTGPISVHVEVSGVSGVSAHELGTEIARQTGYELWQQIKPHWEAAMLRIYRSFKKHEAPDIKGVTP